jgi:hypothetical protein
MLLILGLPVTFLSANALVRFFARTWREWRANSTLRGPALAHAVLYIMIFMTLAQYIAYLHKYRETCNQHSGYLFPALFCSCLLVGEYAKQASVRFQRGLVASLGGLSAICIWTFWL